MRGPFKVIPLANGQRAIVDTRFEPNREIEQLRDVGLAVVRAGKYNDAFFRTTHGGKKRDQQQRIGGVGARANRRRATKLIVEKV